MDEKGCEKIALTCTNDILSNGSVKGKWSETDKQKFRNDLQKLEDLSAFGENKTAWIECYLSKCELTFSSYYEANNNEKKCSEIVQECTSEFL